MRKAAHRLAAPVAAAAEAASVRVITVRRAGGPAVRPGAIIRAGLARRSAATFSLGPEVMRCASAVVRATVTRNPPTGPAACQGARRARPR